VNSVQANPNKTKENCLDFLGFIRPNRDFSMGYEQKNKKIESRLKLCAKRLNPRFSFRRRHVVIPDSVQQSGTI
jgi:hypothetical protein